MARWRRHGLLFGPDRARWWQRTHAALPTALALPDGLHRVYFAARDAQQRSHVGWFDADLAAGRVVGACEEPVLAPGPLGHFDDAGVYAASAVRDGDRVHLYTIGWNVGAPPPMFRAAIGRATSTDGGRTFAKDGRAPLLDRSEHDPWMVSAPYVLREGGRWRMWYLSGQGWDREGGVLRSRYDVKHAESVDGVSWVRDGRTCLGGERNVSRAWVLQGPGGYRAWFSADDGAGYRIAAATSVDGLDWLRDDPGDGLEPSGAGWDAAEMAYPCVVPLAAGGLALLYNGGGFGRDGIGLATLAP